jgi:hypothetical protein
MAIATTASIRVEPEISFARLTRMDTAIRDPEIAISTPTARTMDVARRNGPFA